jgi:hypothetical protein
MNFSANRPLPAHMRKVWCYCFLGFIPALMSKVGERCLRAAERRTVPVEQFVEVSSPYLVVVGPPPLRFQEPVAIPSCGPSPPKAAATPQLAEPKQSGSPPALVSPALTPASQAPANDSAGNRTPPGSEPGVPSIIPDEVRPQVRPEEFLPFFQPPGAGPAKHPPADQPPPLPPSSATYRLE